MAHSLPVLSSISSSPFPSPHVKVAPANSWRPSFSIRSQALPRSSKHDNDRNSKRTWRRRKLMKRDNILFNFDRVPFLEEKVRKLDEGGGLLSGDIERLMLAAENRYEFVNEVAAEATAYLESNRDEYGHKKPILHVLSNRMNDLGFERPEAYMKTDPYKPGPGYLKIEPT